MIDELVLLCCIPFVDTDGIAGLIGCEVAKLGLAVNRMVINVPKLRKSFFITNISINFNY